MRDKCGEKTFSDSFGRKKAKKKPKLRNKPNKKFASQTNRKKAKKPILAYKKGNLATLVSSIVFVHVPTNSIFDLVLIFLDQHLIGFNTINIQLKNSWAISLKSKSHGASQTLQNVFLPSSPKQ